MLAMCVCPQIIILLFVDPVNNSPGIVVPFDIIYK